MTDDCQSQPSAPPKRSGALKKIWSIAKWLIMAAAVYYLWREGALWDRLRLDEAAYWAIPGAMACLFLSTALICIRFHGLVRCLGCPSDIREQAKFHFPGLLVQQIGSDAAYDIMRLIGTKRLGGAGAGVFAALMMDRLLGLLALTVIAAVGLSQLWDGPEWLLAAGGVAALLVLAPVVLALFHSLSRARADSWLWRIPGSGFIAGVGGAVKAFRRHWAMLGGLFALSLVAHLCMFAALFFCGRALAGMELRPPEAVLAGALSTFTGVLPLPMAGLGVGEVAFGAAVAKMRGVGDAVDFAGVFLVNRFLILCLGVASWIWLALAKERR